MLWGVCECHQLKRRMSLRKSACSTRNTRCTLASHSIKEGHGFDFDNVKILDRKQNHYNSLVLEVYHRNSSKCSVNFRTNVDNKQ